MSDETRTAPQAPDVLERETLDDGFSAGWMMHALPSEACIVDAHTHMFHTEPAQILEAVEEWHHRMFPCRLACQIALDAIPERLEGFAEAARKDPRLQFLLRLSTNDTPDADLVSRAQSMGAVGVKLHNQGLMSRGADPELYLQTPWREVLQACEESGMCILWHVTQRYSDSPYTGGGRMSYWKNQPGFDPEDPSSIVFGNRAQMAVFEQVLSDYPRLKIVGAHQLHVGYPRLEELLTRYPNLYYDISIGGAVRWGDRMRKRDADYIRAHITRFSDRVLFGTDVHFNPGKTYWRMREQHFLGHVRFIRQLELPDEVLQNVCWRNAVHVYGLPSMESDPGQWGFLRP